MNQYVYSDRMAREDGFRESGACGAKPSTWKIECLLDDGHQGPHRWWDEDSVIKWVPHSESWRKEPSGDFIEVEAA